MNWESKRYKMAEHWTNCHEIFTLLNSVKFLSNIAKLKMGMEKNSDFILMTAAV